MKKENALYAIRAAFEEIELAKDGSVVAIWEESACGYVSAVAKSRFRELASNDKAYLRWLNGLKAGDLVCVINRNGQTSPNGMVSETREESSMVQVYFHCFVNGSVSSLCRAFREGVSGVFHLEMF